MRIFFLGLLSILLCVACSEQHDHKGKTPLVELDGNFLYRQDLQSGCYLFYPILTELNRIEIVYCSQNITSAIGWKMSYYMRKRRVIFPITGRLRNLWRIIARR